MDECMSVVFAKNGWSLEGPRANIVFMFSVNVSVGGDRAEFSWRSEREFRDERGDLTNALRTGTLSLKANKNILMAESRSLGRSSGEWKLRSIRGRVSSGEALIPKPFAWSRMVSGSFAGLMRMCWDRKMKK